MEIFGDVVRTDQLEARVLADVTETLNLFNHVIPHILRGSVSVLREVIQGRK